jgi:3-hydroxyacyl-CoA dehydrogenase/enoyl-CoA hydratase/3-hydroxybutyryl-CoA epimerase
MGIGFPANSGGAAQFMTGYQAVDAQGTGVGPIGLEAFLARAGELAERYGERFRPSVYLRDLAARGESFPG